MSKGFASNYRIVLLAGLLFLGFGGIGMRLVWLHVINRDELIAGIAKTRRQLIIDPARRGNIYDARGALLATSAEVLQLGVDPQSLRKEDEKKWPRLAALIGLPEAELRRIFITKYYVPRKSGTGTAGAGVAGSGPTWPDGFAISLNLAGPPPAVAAAREPEAVATDIELPVIAVPAPTEADTTTDAPEADPDSDADGRRKIQWAVLAKEISEATDDAVKKLGIKGVYSVGSYRRIYPHNQLGAHVVGFVNRAQHPVVGVERFADFYLRGQDGWREGERDGRAKELPQFSTRAVEHVDGYGVTLSLDTNIQNIVERELAIIAEKFDPKKATIIVSDPRTGFILGLGNYPTFNPNEYNKVPRDQLARLNNLAVSDVYEPGSVFKIVAASGALDRGLVTPGTRFDCSITKIDYNGSTRRLPDEAHHFDHPLTVAEIIAHSSNRGAAQLAMLTGEERFYGYAQAFGFGSRTGLLGSTEADKSRRGLMEEPGLMHRPGTKSWDGLTITRMPMGQSVAVTVLQMHQAMSVIAAGGVLLEPQLISQIRDNAGNVVYNFGRVERHRAISERTARTMAQLLAGCVAPGGTAPEAAIPGYEVAGKTGTTQKYLPLVLPDGTPVLLASGKPKLVPSRLHHVSSFVGFFPATNPKVVISVVVDDADHRYPGAPGGKVAAPSFRHIGEQLIPILDDLKAGDRAAPVSPNRLVASQSTRP